MIQQMKYRLNQEPVKIYWSLSIIENQTSDNLLSFWVVLLLTKMYYMLHLNYTI